jgi:hypothetical protein
MAIGYFGVSNVPSMVKPPVLPTQSWTTLVGLVQIWKASFLNSHEHENLRTVYTASLSRLLDCTVEEGTTRGTTALVYLQLHRSLYTGTVHVLPGVVGVHPTGLTAD